MTDRLKQCPFCGGKVKAHGPEDWKPTFYDPDSGGDPYGFYCECGMEFDTNSYDYEEAVKKFNTRKPMDRIVEQLEAIEIKSEYGEVYHCNIHSAKNCVGVNCYDCLKDKTIEIVKSGGIDE